MAEYECPRVPPASVDPSDDAYKTKPDVDGAFKFVGGERLAWTGDVAKVTSPVIDKSTGERAVIGRVAQFSESDAVEAVEAASKAWDRGQGVWPQMALADRIAAVERYVELLKDARESIVHSLMWEICKNTADAGSEFDRTMQFSAQVIETIEKSDEQAFGDWTTISGIRGRCRRGPVGVTMMLAPFNYPLNEMYAMMIPALLMGNVIVLKLPAIGGLAHILTADALKKAFPPGVVNFVTGAGRKTMGPIMKTGLVDCLGFIGGAKATDALIVQHPQPHRLKIFTQLEGKNIGIVLPDANLDVTAEQIVLGSLSYNGQRCTAVKLVMVHESVAEALKDKVTAKINALKVGLPWESGAKITPLPEPAKPDYLEAVIKDAVSKGASVVNAAAGGGTRAGALFTPAVLFPVTPTMRVFVEEQFGPVVPIATYSNISEVDAAVRASWNGQQASIFTADPKQAAPLVDMLSTVVGRINLNAQCGRGPDLFPFSGRRSSAMGTMSVSEAIRAFSVETIVAFPDNEGNRRLAEDMADIANFFQPLSKKAKVGEKA